MRTYSNPPCRTPRTLVAQRYRSSNGLLKRAPVAATLLLALSAHAEPEPAAPPDGALSPPALTRRGVDSIGSISVGHPHAGFLFNAVQLPESRYWVRTVPELSWGTEETIIDLTRCIRKVHEQFPHSQPVMIGAISAERGGPLPPHKSHRTGRDVDVYLFRENGGKWYRAATAADLDRPRSWALMRAFATETDVDMILLDRKLQALLEAYALSIGEDPVFVEDLFHGRGRWPNPLVKHVPGHVAHMHVRFTSPIARERGRAAYEQLVELGHLDLPSRAVVHEVVAGDTLLGIAKRYNTTPAAIMEKNGLSTTTIFVGRKLTIVEREDIRDATSDVVIPPRHRPAHPPRPREDVAAAPRAPTPPRALTETPTSG
jgi:murein endopeptidase